ncbi:ABC transporter ATP-binding protein [Clostridium oceanicum]|uniref:ABC transporter ATP-binding protein n=1 Tax=Clostridium oceanicum TaxID=1543 RepID=A0ABN1JF71_9CLOT
MSIISVKNVSKSFGKHSVLNNISLNVDKGEILCLIGPSGAGKTTLVKSIMGMEKIDSGEILVLDTKIPNRQILQKIGYMGQSDGLYEDLSARDNLKFFCNLFSVSKNSINKRIEYAANLVDLSKDLKKKTRDFSGGMKRRLSLAISLIQDPDLLILDEPTVGIDPMLRINIWKELYNLKNSGKTIIVTTHVMDEAEKCDKLALLRDGKITAQGKPKELKEKFNSETIEEIFLKAGSEK